MSKITESEDASEGTDASEGAEPRVNKREFVSRVAKRAGVPVRVASLVYDSMIEELIEIVGSGLKLTLTGLGKFYAQPHKGHRVRVGFKKGVSGDASDVEDYTMLKFSAIKAVNQAIHAKKKTLDPKA